MTSQHEDEPPMFADPRRETEEALFEMGAGYGDLRAEQGDDLDESPEPWSNGTDGDGRQLMRWVDMSGGHDPGY